MKTTTTQNANNKALVKATPFCARTTKQSKNTTREAIIIKTTKLIQYI